MSMCELYVVSAMVIFPAAENGCILICPAENLTPLILTPLVHSSHSSLLDSVTRARSVPCFSQSSSAGCVNSSVKATGFNNHVC